MLASCRFRGAPGSDAEEKAPAAVQNSRKSTEACLRSEIKVGDLLPPQGMTRPRGTWADSIQRVVVLKTL
ncbi:hypothetical protein MATL_G00015570 [Megalops atlanticus]|uniref:Uncharacterized protein n=1 Tax=Megalops atlanticus TaxID=7932 RepID=A0A9D3QLU5_MEGAT|nr:hypothetical protein MATL_G00015570 [Megalops atlanticus]